MSAHPSHRWRLLLMLAPALLLAACERRPLPPRAAEADGAAVASSAPSTRPSGTAPDAPLDPASPQAGALLAQRGLGAVPACASCHGDRGEGQPAAAGAPRLAGQPLHYLLRQLDGYADGRRHHAVMAPVAQQLTPPQRQAVSAYYAMLVPLSSGPAATDAEAAPASQAELTLLQRARELDERGSEGARVQACVQCHGVAGQGGEQAAPSLAGLPPVYLQSALMAWRDGSRRTDPSGQMPAIARGLTENDQRALAYYFARQPVPPIAVDALAAWQKRRDGERASAASR